jgi:ribosomal protein S18 acetylase RimI-like enzyme
LKTPNVGRRVTLYSPVVHVVSMGYRTDLALLQLGGTQVEDHGDHLVARSPHNPTFWWGNFLLLPTVPTNPDPWIQRFAECFPDAGHVAIGFDSPGSIHGLEAFAERGLQPNTAAVLTANRVYEPPYVNREAVYRRLISDDDWRQSVDLELRADEDRGDATSHAFVEAKAATNRQLSEAGHGGWFGAFLDGRLVAQMGLFRASSALARFQSVETDPEFRRRGLCGSLVHAVAGFGYDALGATTLVMVADPADVAIRIYRSVGFVESEMQLQVERPPAG